MLLEISTLEYIVPIISGVILFGLFTVFIIYFILVYRRTQYKLDWERARIQQELLRVENEVKEQTLANVSRELHDNYGQIASLLKINLNMISKDLSEKDRVKVDESITLIKQLIVDIKSLSSSLNGDNIRNMGWIEIIEEEIRRVNSIGTMQISFSNEGSIHLTHEKQVILFRIIQEVINNSMKYAKAKTAVLKIESKNKKIYIDFSDTGIGFDQNEIIRGNGLKNIKDRCEMIDAKLDFFTKKGEGTRISIIIVEDGKQ